jgi:hypothetical protein
VTCGGTTKPRCRGPCSIVKALPSFLSCLPHERIAYSIPLFACTSWWYACSTVLRTFYKCCFISALFFFLVAFPVSFRPSELVSDSSEKLIDWPVVAHIIFSGSTCHVKKNHTEGKGEHKALYLRVQIFARISGDTEDRTGQSYKHKTSPDTVERGHVLRASKVETVQSTVGGLCCFHLTRPVPIPCLATTPS